MSIYLSGPIKGIDDARHRFDLAVSALRQVGQQPLNPFDCPPLCLANCPGEGTDEHYDCYMRADLRAMLECDGVAMLPGWQKSRGARLEHSIALQVGLPVRHLAEWVSLPVVAAAERSTAGDAA